ncbi:glycosyltransferase [Cereibacter azotoformans]|nr:glycosyltransferase [Cereibacter azotoformans]
MSRVLILVVAGPEGYGVRNVWSLLVRTLEQSGLHVVIAVLDLRLVDGWRRDFPGVDVIHPPVEWRPLAGGSNRIWRIVRRGISQLKLADWLDGVVRRYAARGIVLQGPIEALLCGLVARRRGIPALWFVPNAVSDEQFLDINKRIYRSLFRHANVIPVANSKFTDSTLGRGNFRRHVIHLGVDTEFYRPEPDDGTVRERFRIPRTAIVIGLFARMTPSKGQLELVKAAARLQENVHLLFCGGPLEGTYHQTLASTVAALNFHDRVHFAGFQTDLRPYYGACDILANLRTDPEPFGLTVVEAMACGRAVLAHASGGPAETIIDGRTGWLIPHCSPDDIAGGLHRVIADRLRWLEMGLAGRARAEAEFSVKRFEVKVCEVVKTEIHHFESCAGTSYGEASNINVIIRR